MPKKGPTLNSRGSVLSAYEPSLRDKIAWALSDAFGGGDRSRTNYINEKVRGAVDFAPVIGDLATADDAKRSFDAGNYGQAAFEGASAAVGSVPGVGDALAAGLKAGGGSLGMLIGPMSRLWNEDMARKAQDMAEDFQPPGRIWAETGSEWNPKNKAWQQEIPDFRARIDPEMTKYGFGNDPSNVFMLDNILSHPDLFDAYPDLRKVGVMEVEAADPIYGPQYEGAFFVQTPPNLNPWAGLDDATAESWATENIPDSLLTLRSTPSVSGVLSDPRDVALHEIQHAIQAREGWEGGSNQFKAMNQLKTRPDSFPAQMFNNVLAALPDIGPVSDDRAFAIMDDVANRVAYETYLRNAGETQARVVQARKDFMPDTVRRLRPSMDILKDSPFSGTMDRKWDEQLTEDDLMYGVYGPNDVPKYSNRGPARRQR